MENLSAEELILYQKNKNIILEGENTKVMKKKFDRLLTFFKKKSLPKIKTVFTARVIEYPIIFHYIRRDAKDILDFGCVEDILPLHLASMGYQVTGLDFRHYPFQHKNFNFIQADILQWKPLVEQFDAVCSVSTIEHVGLSAYGDPEQGDGDKIAINKLWVALRKGGDLIVTLPAGKPCIKRGMRIYDKKAIEKIFPKVDELRFFFKPARYQMWEETTENLISGLVYEDYNALAPAQGLAIVVAKKNHT